MMPPLLLLVLFVVSIGLAFNVPNVVTISSAVVCFASLVSSIIVAAGRNDY